MALHFLSKWKVKENPSGLLYLQNCWEKGLVEADEAAWDLWSRQVWTCHTTDIREYTHTYTSGRRSREGMGEAKLVSTPF